MKCSVGGRIRDEPERRRPCPDARTCRCLADPRSCRRGVVPTSDPVNAEVLGVRDLYPWLPTKQSFEPRSPGYPAQDVKAGLVPSPRRLHVLRHLMMPNCVGPWAFVRSGIPVMGTIAY